MKPARCIAAVLAGAILMFVWHGVAQTFPWGVSVVRNFSSTSGPTYVASTSALRQAPPGTWTTTEFDEEIGNGISTLATDASFAWVISTPREDYALGRYFAFHALTQLVLAALLFAVSAVLNPLSRRRRIFAVSALGLTAASGIYGGMLNWMGMPSAYGLGQVFNHGVALTLGFAVIDRIVSPTLSGEFAASVRNVDLPGSS